MSKKVFARKLLGVWDNPPVQSYRRKDPKEKVKLEAIIRKVVNNPNKWMAIFEYPETGKSAAYSAACTLRKKYLVTTCVRNKTKGDKVICIVYAKHDRETDTAEIQDKLKDFQDGVGVH